MAVAKWFMEKWVKGHMLENSSAKLIWDFEFNLHKTTIFRRPDLVLEDKERMKIWIYDMACPFQEKISGKRQENIIKYRQLAFEVKERGPW